MKHSLYLLALLILPAVMGACQSHAETPRVFVFTDINIDAGDPDDRQSLIHLLWYANELKIEGVVPDRWEARGLEACQLVVNAYASDYTAYHFEQKGFPAPESLRQLLATDQEDAFTLFQKAASSRESPLYVLVWGNMVNLGKALQKFPELSDNIRLVTIGTHLMMEDHRQHLPVNWEKTEKPCEQYNWNGGGRKEIFADPRFRDMWWLEINWTYEGMFPGNEPKEMFQKLSAYGALGQHMKEVVRNESWAQYFRVGDTPSVLYVIDPENPLHDPTNGSWAGRYKQPFPEERPNYFTDLNGPVEWNYADPCETWQNHVAMNQHAKNTLLERRDEMYAALLDKLDHLYNKQ